MQLLILSLLMVLSSAQWDVLVMWNRTFDGGYGYDDRGYSIIKSDDGYVIVGNAKMGNYVWVIKIDNNGDHVWNRTFDGGYNGDYSIVRSDDGGYVIVGSSYQYNNHFDVWVIKIDNNGNHVWNRTFHGGYGRDYGHFIIKSDDGGYVIVGESYQGSNNNDVWVIKIDTNGNHVWNRTFHGGYASDVGRSIIKSDDGGYVIVGESYQGSNNNDVWVIKIDTNG
ncbi:MAG: hypothetical protein QXQ78_03280, partial [Candidatus Anstonellales archaeon]